MRVSFLVYGVLYVAVEIVGNQLETVGWPNITPLDVAEALTNAMLAIVICIAIVVGVDLGRERWGPALRAWHVASRADRASRGGSERVAGRHVLHAQQLLHAQQCQPSVPRGTRPAALVGGGQSASRAARASRSWASSAAGAGSPSSRARAIATSAAS
jgi:hypothetical protein